MDTTCKLCAPNCGRCSIKFDNCISCKTGWALFVDPDVANANPLVAVVSDYCVPSDGVSHWSGAGLHGAATTDWGNTGSKFEWAAGPLLTN